MIIFHDMYHNEVNLSFTTDPFASNPKHVWVVCRYEDKWLLTNHSERGLEFPGGKVEDGESPEHAAIREVKEETGADVKIINYIGQYRVNGKGKTIIKNIYYAIVDQITAQQTYFETKGPVLLSELPLASIRHDQQYSFIMKDDVLQNTIKYIEQNFIKSKKAL
ncbi:RNA deprotection pyrophosphohydrolase [Fredinandcohnia humi]